MHGRFDREPLCASYLGATSRQLEDPGRFMRPAASRRDAQLAFLGFVPDHVLLSALALILVVSSVKVWRHG